MTLTTLFVGNVGGHCAFVLTFYEITTNRKIC